MLSRDSEDQMGCDLCLRLWYDLKRLLWQDELNPRVRCAFGNVYFRPRWILIRPTLGRVLTCEKPTSACPLGSLHWQGPLPARSLWNPNSHFHPDPEFWGDETFELHCKIARKMARNTGKKENVTWRKHREITDKPGVEIPENVIEKVDCSHSRR